MAYLGHELRRFKGLAPESYGAFRKAVMASFWSLWRKDSGFRPRVTRRGRFEQIPAALLIETEQLTMEALQGSSPKAILDAQLLVGVERKMVQAIIDEELLAVPPSF